MSEELGRKEDGTFLPGHQHGFKPGHAKVGGAGSLALPKSFRQLCLDLLQGDPLSYDNPIKVIREILVGYKGVKPADRLAAAKLVIAYAEGLPVETHVNANVNGSLKDLQDSELLDMVKEFERTVVKAQKVVDVEPVGPDASSTPSGDQAPTGTGEMPVLPPERETGANS